MYELTSFAAFGSCIALASQSALEKDKHCCRAAASHVQCHLTMCNASPCMRSLIKDELEPHMRDYSPSVVNGLFFERLSFGLVPMSIMGVRIVPQTYSGQNVAIGEAIHIQTLAHFIGRLE